MKALISEIYNIITITDEEIYYSSDIIQYGRFWKFSIIDPKMSYKYIVKVSKKSGFIGNIYSIEVEIKHNKDYGSTVDTITFSGHLAAKIYKYIDSKESEKEKLKKRRTHLSI